MNITPYTILVSQDYDIFKKLLGNRDVPENRVKKVYDSIQTIGFVMQPILVNEKYEVIDGQARLEALKRLNMPVYYTQQPGLTREHCIALNMNQTNWTMLDYISSHAESGIKSYEYLLDVFEGVGKYFSFRVVYYAFTGLMDSNPKCIKDGRFECTEKDYHRAVAILTWLKELVPIIRGIGGRIDCYYNSLIFCYMDQNINNSRLREKITLYQANLIPVTTIYQALRQVENVYNYRTRNKVYIETDYKRCVDNKCHWYNTEFTLIENATTE